MHPEPKNISEGLGNHKSAAPWDLYYIEAMFKQLFHVLQVLLLQVPHSYIQFWDFIIIDNKLEHTWALKTCSIQKKKEFKWLESLSYIVYLN